MINNLTQFYAKYSVEPSTSGIIVKKVSDGGVAFVFPEGFDFTPFLKADDIYYIGCEIFSKAIFEDVFVTEISDYIAGAEYTSFWSDRATEVNLATIKAGTETGSASS